MRKLVSILVLTMLAFVSNQTFGSVTFENIQMMSFTDRGWGAPDSVCNGLTDQGVLGVDFDVHLGTVDFGKLPLGVTQTANWSGETDFYLKIELLSASGGNSSIGPSVELNPFVQTGSNWTWYENKDLVVLGVGQSYVQHWDLTGVADLDTIHGFGFQLFTAGGVEAPPALDAVVRVTAIPEPATICLLSIGSLLLGCRKKL